MIVRVLGSAAGGGVPQWNCGCANCRSARAGRISRRSQSSIAISADGRQWALLNCSPDVATQIEAFPPLHPSPPRGTPITGMLLTDANVDHIGGLAVLRQRGAKGFRVRSSAVVRAIAAEQRSFAPFTSSPHRWLVAPLGELCANDGDGDPIGDSLLVRALAVPGMTPGYDGRRGVRGAVVAYEIRDRGSAASLLFAPVFSRIDDTLRAAIVRASVAILDGSFYTDDELVVGGLLEKRARALGHQPLGEATGTLEQLPGGDARIIFTHLNNSNPVLDPRSAAHAHVRDAGAEVAYDGMELTL